MSRILKALATIESKGATLTLSLPREASLQQPKRREGERRAELSLASLEAYLQAALSAEQPLMLEAEVDEAVALYCTPGDNGPTIGAPDLAAAEVDESSAVTEWVRRETGPAARFTFVDRELTDLSWDELAEESLRADLASDDLAAFDLTATPASEILETAEAEFLDWSDAVYDLASAPVETPAPAVAEVEVVSEPVVETIIENLDSLIFELTGELDIEACGFVAETPAAESVECVTPMALPGWPEAFPTESPPAPLPEVDVNAATWLVAPAEFGWLTGYDLTPAEALEQQLLAAPDWVEVDAAIEALPLVVETPLAAPPPQVEPPPVAPPPVRNRRRLTSRDLLPDEYAWAECRAIADAIRESRLGSKPANYLLVELDPAAGRTPLVAPLAAMLAETTGERILLVDTDCWRSDAVDQLSGETVRGFADLYRSPNDWPALVLRSAVSRLDVLPAGSGVAQAERREGDFSPADWLAMLSRSYDLVLLHASWPGDGSLATLATAADATLIVAPLGNLAEDTAHAALDRLRRWGARVEGCIVVGGGE